MSKLETISNIYPEPHQKLPMLGIGDILYDKERAANELHLIAQVDYGKVCVVSLTDGNRITAAIKVGSVSNITLAEFKDMIGSYSDVQDWVRVNRYNEDVVL